MQDDFEMIAESSETRQAVKERLANRFSTLAFGPFVFDLPSPLFIGPPLDFIFQEYLVSLSPDRQHFRCFCLFFAHPTRSIWADMGDSRAIRKVNIKELVFR